MRRDRHGWCWLWALVLASVLVCSGIGLAATTTCSPGDAVLCTGVNELDVQILKQNGIIVGTSTPNLWSVRANQSLAAGTTIAHGSRTDVIEVVQISSTGGAVISSASPRIAAGLNGQTILLQGTSATNTYTIPDGSGIKLESTSAITFTDRTSMFLTYITSLAVWRQDTSIGGGAGGGVELLVNKSTVAAPVNNGYMGADATGNVPYNRIGTFAQHPSALSPASAITVSARQMGIEGSGGPVSLSSAIQMVAGVANQEVELIGTHDSNTVQLNNGNGLRLCENVGSVVVGLNGAKPIFRYNSILTVWEQIGCTGRAVYGATNLATAGRWCDVPGGLCMHIFGGTIQATNAGANLDSIVNIPATKNYILQGNGTEFERVTVAGLQTFSGAGKPLKSLYLAADALYMQGCTLVTDAALVSGGLIEPYITCGDNDAHGFHRSLVMPQAWDVSTITVELNVINVNATPSNNYRVDFSAACVSNADVIPTTISTTGQQSALIDFDAGQTCGGSACAQNARAKVTTTAITPNGACAKGDLLRLQGQIDATTTTTTQVADVKILGILLKYTVDSRSD